ncbi:TPA: MgtC/SapB family protein [Vibrio diabolicus]|jgi:putative Mg2+ transporter-C (MgtC) family protein|uniref:Protein MgtC n=1 Tax=Vibrio diabolicus TaxID=50719 RepID=A0AAX1XH75_9VIBR|nr:MgtC/SapB family protein [Vibrio diabolicus]UFN69407.1 MgtC/SapB family protein [Vibrio alginolyticus]AVF96370.1 MgtC/SapB family protein [Vibrio diabolicus]KLE22634.1 membrane protein [Vibrio diabolicus]MCR9305317.1 MgtC/SapB family protein [Vibrio diabolicus]MCR9426993.1 MgtC/SapB family protein [Vibrio diabolicus]
MHTALEQIFDLGPFSWPALLCCAINGLMIGIERQTRGKPVGIRTAILIISGTYLFMSMAVSLSPNTLDQARVLGQIITGVGFLGAGVMMTLDGKIHGVTSAAVIWVLAGLGLMIGLGYLTQSVVITLLTLTVLLGVDKAENHIKALRRGVHQRIQQRKTSSRLIK